MIKKAILAMFFSSAVVNAQVWVEEYNYTENELSSSKWTPANIYSGPPTMTFTGSYMNLESPVQNYGFTPNGFPSSIYKWTWYNSLPLDHDWSIVQRFRPNYSPASQFSNILGGIKYDYQEINTENGPEQYAYLTFGNSFKIITASWDYQWMGLSYNSSLLKLSAVYSDDSDLSVPPSINFVVIGETDLSNTSEQIPVFHQTHFYNGNGSMDFSKVSIIASSVPEPSALSLLAVGLGGLAMMRRRRS
jgi:hypothetical protein